MRDDLAPCKLSVLKHICWSHHIRLSGGRHTRKSFKLPPLFLWILHLLLFSLSPCHHLWSTFPTSNHVTYPIVLQGFGVFLASESLTERHGWVGVRYETRVLSGFLATESSRRWRIDGGTSPLQGNISSLTNSTLNMVIGTKKLFSVAFHLQNEEWFHVLSVCPTNKMIDVLFYCWTEWKSVRLGVQKQAEETLCSLYLHVFGDICCSREYLIYISSSDWTVMSLTLHKSGALQRDSLAEWYTSSLLTAVIGFSSISFEYFVRRWV